MTRPYIQMTAEETNKFQVIIALYRALKLTKWQSAEMAKQFAAEVDAIAALGNELEAPGDVIPYDARQGEKSIFASDFSWNTLINERNAAGTFATAELVTALAGYQAAIGADVAH
jgi:hypothetical protein